MGGRYLAVGDWGTVLKSVLLIEGPVATTGDATEITVTSARLNGTVNPKGTATLYHFEYGPTDTLGTSSPELSLDAGTIDVAVSQALTSLPAGDTVYFRLVANNTLGTSNGAIKQFVTHEGPIATTGDATEITLTSARLNGTVNPKGTATSVPLRVWADGYAGHELSRAVSGYRDESM